MMRAILFTLFLVLIHGGCGVGVYSTADTMAPDSATGLTWSDGVTIDHHTLNISWTRPEGQEQSAQEVQFFSDSSCTTALSTWISAPANTLTAYVTDLMPSFINTARFSFKVRVTDAEKRTSESVCSEEAVVNVMRTLKDPEATNDEGFGGTGTTLAMHGTTLFISEPYEGGTYGYQGAVVVKELKQNGQWETTKLSPPDPHSGGVFGTSLAVSEDGLDLIIGSPNWNGLRGKVYWFQKNGSGEWSYVDAVTASDAVAGDLFGYSVAVFGNTLVVGAPEKSTNAGAFYIYTKSGGAWTNEVKHSGTGTIKLGTKVVIHGNHLFASAPGFSTSRGIVYHYEWNGSAWVQTETMSASNGANGDLFGTNMSYDGSRLFVGATGKNSSRGAAYLFEDDGIGWLETRFTASDGAASDLYGISLSVYGEILVVGSSNKSVGGKPNAGKVYVYHLQNDGSWAETGLDSLNSESGAVEGAKLGSTVLVNDVGFIFSAPRDGFNPYTGLVYFFPSRSFFE